jgi:hypothetical protein
VFRGLQGDSVILFSESFQLGIIGIDVQFERHLVESCSILFFQTSQGLFEKLDTVWHRRSSFGAYVLSGLASGEVSLSSNVVPQTRVIA